MASAISDTLSNDPFPLPLRLDFSLKSPSRSCQRERRDPASGLSRSGARNGHEIDARRSSWGLVSMAKELLSGFRLALLSIDYRLWTARFSQIDDKDHLRFHSRKGRNRHLSCIFTTTQEIAESNPMEANVARHWDSLAVPSVQEMVKEKEFTTVPPRYVRSDLDKAEIVHEFGPKLEIPVIDVERLCSATIMDSELEKLDLACREWGFFQLVNHGVDSCFLDKVKVGIQALFNLPMAEKKKLWQRSGDIEGFGQAFVVSEEQKLDWGDMLYVTTQPVKLRKAHLFSQLPLPFRDTLDMFSTEVKKIAKILIAKTARALKIKPEEMEDLFNEDLWQSMRMNYYPPCPQPDQVIGLTPHSDAVALISVLFQVNEVEGLQVKKDGKWVPVKPLPNAFVINVGDITEIITNGVYQSVEHRAMVNEEKERLSVAVFHSPGFGTEIGLARSLVERRNKAFFKRMSAEKYYNDFFAKELNGKSQLELMRI